MTTYEPRPSDASQRWAEMLAQWAIPDELIASVLESPYFFDPDVFIAAADDALSRADDTVSDRVAREELPADGSVLDVGAGAGAASLRLAPTRLTAVDPQPALLDALDQRARRVGTSLTRLEGTWPDAAGPAPVADVVVCHHVVYNVPDLAAFLLALSEHAARRVVIELTAEHPMAWMRSYWQAMHGREQPHTPTAEHAIVVAATLGLDPQVQRWQRRYQMIGETGDDALARVARRLCLAPERHEALRAVLDATPPPVEREVVTMWW
jgi:SAM-dependent methyltransferase